MEAQIIDLAQRRARKRALVVVPQKKVIVVTLYRFRYPNGEEGIGARIKHPDAPLPFRAWDPDPEARSLHAWIVSWPETTKKEFAIEVNDHTGEGAYPFARYEALMEHGSLK